MTWQDLRTWRRDKGLSQDAAAETIGVTRRVYQTAESGEREPQGDNALAFADYFQCRISDLWPLEAPSASTLGGAPAVACASCLGRRVITEYDGIEHPCPDCGVAEGATV